MTEDLAGKLAQLLPGGVSPDTVRALAAHARERHLQAGDTLLRQGDAATHVYVVVSGRLRAVLDDVGDSPYPFAVLEPGAVLGEIAVLTGGQREATVLAETAATVIELTVTDFDRLLEGAPDLARRLAELATHRVRQAQLARQLRTLFPEAGDRLRGAILGCVDWVALEAGEALVQRGDEADAAYILVTGRLQVAENGRMQTGSADIGPGELVGEMALVEGGVRTATLVAVRETHVARIPREGFLDALREYPEVLLRIARSALQRRMDGAPVQGAERRTIALVGLHPAVELPAFAEVLATELRRADVTGLLTRAHAEEAIGARSLGPDSPGLARLIQWLQEQEVRYGTLLLQTSADWGPWNEVVMRHADHVVLVADAGADPAMTATEVRIRETLGARMQGQGARRVRQSLVLLHANPGAATADCPRGTARWLAPRDVDACYHLRRGRAGDLSRLARILAERPVCLVLSGGGARGFAHLGVVRALQEAGVPVDRVGGTSMGAVMATFVAFDVGADEQAARAKAVLTRAMLDWTLPLAGLIKGGRMAELADAVTGRRDAEDLWLPWFALSTNLTRSEVCAHHRGSITRALRASTAIPGVVPPVAYGDELHVDGGVLDNVPVETMRSLNPRGVVIAVDVAGATTMRAGDEFGLSVSGWGLLARRLLPGARSAGVPGIAATLVQSMIAGSSQGRERVMTEGLADLYLELDLPRCGMFQFDAADRIIAAGYAAAAPRVREWAATLPQHVRSAPGEGTPVASGGDAPISARPLRTD